MLDKTQKFLRDGLVRCMASYSVRVRSNGHRKHRRDTMLKDHKNGTPAEDTR